MKLFDYQENCINALREAISRKESRLLVKAPCSFGKTIVFCEISRRVFEKKKRVLIIIDSVALVEQTVVKMKRFVHEDEIGIYCASLGEKDDSKHITVSTIQSIANSEASFDLIIIDEAHAGIVRINGFCERGQNKGCTVIGFTATPYNAKGFAIYGEDKFYKKLVFSMGAHELIMMKKITPMVYKGEKQETKIDLKDVKVVGGEYVESDLQRVYDIEKVKVSAQIEDMVSRTQDRNKVIIMTTGIAHANYVESILPSSIAYHSEVSTEERAEILKRFEHGDIKYLIGVMAIYKGLDITSVDCIVNMRPTRSYSFYVQLCGRGVRLHPGKENCLMLDYGQTVLNLGYYEDFTENTGKQRKGIAPIFHDKECPTCLSIVKAQVNICECGYIFRKIATKNTEVIPFNIERPAFYEHEIENITVFHDYESKNGNKMKMIQVELVGHTNLRFYYPDFKRGEFFSVINVLKKGKKLRWSIDNNYPRIRSVI